MAAAAARSGFRRRFSSSAFVPPKLRTPHPKADSFPNLFVSGLIKRTTTDGPREAFATFGEVVHASFLKRTRWYMINSNLSSPLTMCNQCRKIFPSLITPPASYSTQASDQNPKERKDLLTIEDPFDAPTYNIPEKPVTFAEGASYSLAILGGLGIAALAGYAVFKELIFEPKEYKIFGKALARVQSDSQVTGILGTLLLVMVWNPETVPLSSVFKTRFGKVNFYIRGPHGAGKVFAEMFKDNSDRTWKFTFLLVEITSPHHAQVILESYIPE